MVVSVTQVEGCSTEPVECGEEIDKTPLLEPLLKPAVCTTEDADDLLPTPVLAPLQSEPILQHEEDVSQSASNTNSTPASAPPAPSATQDNALCVSSPRTQPLSFSAGMSPFFKLQPNIF